MKLEPEKENMEDIPIEEDVPKQLPTSFQIDNENQPKVSKDMFNTIKGHHLLGWCVFVIVVIYMIEFFLNSGKTSDVGNKIIEIVKLLIFSLTGYLFGTNANKN
ncbi:hypothetical protein [Streptococcus equi]|uniref:hypothetical protein n=1 Tax=Streptococcus equi TaxID=1336 RepID=UPI0007CB6641|nr:hypothetical protein [Streptococcus equi]HEK9220948.1 hypothetical protein [Streptococcus equi subsp. equi]HEL1012798.1 hypothetical protein [Streptococcus equi subsp. ruminatorum]MCD3372911.1 hypothetical protein [Streptococcus equi subsp. zooepidemicus]NBK69091.1 hypothetical protein [Streptococcus equi]HEK9238018.1 hypothetical protein [Streptococcus equi subsp. equi]